MFGLVRDGTPEEREACKAHGWPEDFPVSLLGIDKEGCACVTGKDVAARLADCWNACAGMENPADEIAALREQNAKLLEAAKRVVAFLDSLPNRIVTRNGEPTCYDLTVAAIAKAEGRAEA